MKTTRFTADDADRAFEAWGCNCGPSALAAILGLTLDDARRHVGPDFEARRYTNPTMMLAALFSALGPSGARWSVTRRSAWPSYGLARIQWEGPWTEPGVPMAARYRYTHWVGAHTRSSDDRIGVWDVNAMRATADGSGWVALEHWSATIVTWILEGYPRASGRWHITHAIDVARPVVLR